MVDIDRKESWKEPLVQCNSFLVTSHSFSYSSPQHLKSIQSKPILSSNELVLILLCRHALHSIQLPSQQVLIFLLSDSWEECDVSSAERHRHLKHTLQPLFAPIICLKIISQMRTSFNEASKVKTSRFKPVGCV